jgi:hypothetical protein
MKRRGGGKLNQRVIIEFQVLKLLKHTSLIFFFLLLLLFLPIGLSPPPPLCALTSHLRRGRREDVIESVEWRGRRRRLGRGRVCG